MREALNNNPVVQVAVVAVMILLAVFLFMTRMKSANSDSGGDTSAASSPPATSTPGSSSTGGVTGDSATGPTGSSATGAASTPPSASSSAGTVPPEALVPGPGLPQRVIVSWARGDAVVLLIVRNGGIDDKLVQASVSSLERPGIKVFVAKAGQIARYSRITQGVGVNRVPALVVVRPRTGGATVPQAEVSYGFRNAQGVVQAVNDALYKGPDDLPYDPG